MIHVAKGGTRHVQENKRSKCELRALNAKISGWKDQKGSFLGLVLGNLLRRKKEKAKDKIRVYARFITVLWKESEKKKGRFLGTAFKSVLGKRSRSRKRKGYIHTPDLF